MSFHAPQQPPRRMRTLFMSDLHLGARASRAREILAFLHAHEADTIYLVGDIFDIWHGGRLHWSPVHDAVIAEFNRRVRAGTRIIYLSGNHDAALRRPNAPRLPDGWELREKVTHRTASGQDYLVIHGDQCDVRFLRWHWMTRIGSRADAAIRAFDAWLGRRFGRDDLLPKETTIKRLIGAFNGLFVMAGAFERKLVALAEAEGRAGVVCGHSHKPGLHKVGDTVFANCGDWVDSLTALGEEADGALHLIQWSPSPALRPAQRPAMEPGLVNGERM